MQADSIMDEKKRDNNNNENDKIISSNKYSPSIDENNLSYDFYADTTNKQVKKEASSPNYQQIDNTKKKSFTSETSDISNCLNNSDKKDTNLSKKIMEENNSSEVENVDEESPSVKQFISNVKSINSNNRIPISISIENKSTSSLFKTNSTVLTIKDEEINTRKQSSSHPITPISPGFQVVLLLEKSNSISFIVDFQEIDESKIKNNENKENKNDEESNNTSNKDSLVQNEPNKDSNGIVLFPIYQMNDNNSLYQKNIIQMKEDCIDSLSPIQVTQLNKQKEFRNKDIMSKLDPRYLKYEKLILDDIKRRKSKTERNSLELKNSLNNKLMKASILREKFYQKRRLNLKEKHSRINQKKKKNINLSPQKKNILNKKILSKMIKERRSIDYTCIKESLLSSDSSFVSSDSLLSSSSKENVNIPENELSTNIKSENNENNIKKNNNGNNENINNKTELDSNNSNKKSDIYDGSERNNSTCETDTNVDNKDKIIVEENNDKANITNTKIRKEPVNIVVKQVHKHNHSRSRKSSKNGIEKSEIQVHHSKHHHRNDHSSNKKKLNEISTDLLDNISLYNTKLTIPYLPPVTRYTLRELDTDEIITNPQLRHDLYFDPKLQFKPNTDGERGVQKKLKADLCWKEIDYEINQLHNYKRIPLLINEIKCILKEMISYVKDFAEEIDANIDIQLIAQEIKHGVFVPHNLVSYIAKTLKIHCAPARDEYIDKIEELSKENKFVDTLKLIYEVLELMKLDLANHQLTRIRPYVLTHTVEFEWKFFKDQLDKKNISDVNTRNWLQMSLQNQPANSTFNDIYFAGFMKLLLTYNQNRIIPETFRLDKSRIVTFYNEWQDITILSCLLLIFRQACCSKCTSENVLNLKQRLYVLLTSQSTSLKHINLEITNMAGQVRKKAYSTKEIDLISGLIEKTLSPENKLYVMIQTRVSTYIVYYLNNDSLPKELMYRHNMIEMESEISTLSGKIKSVVDLNLQTYSEYYKNIYLELKQQKTNTLIKTLNNVKNENTSTLINNSNLSKSSSNVLINDKQTTQTIPQINDVSKAKMQLTNNSKISDQKVSNNSQNNRHDSNSQI